MTADALLTRVAVALHGVTPPDPQGALALYGDAAARVVAALGLETRPGAQPGETVCEGCIHGPACRVIPCVNCRKSWHLLGVIDNPFVCPRCEDEAA